MRDPRIYSDNGAAFGRRTRVFRNCPNSLGVEWQYAVDHANGDPRWYGYGTCPQETIASLVITGMALRPINSTGGN